MAIGLCAKHGKASAKRRKTKAAGVEPSTSTWIGGVEGRRGNSFTHHAMSCVVCKVLVR